MVRWELGCRAGRFSFRSHTLLTLAIMFLGASCIGQSLELRNRNLIARFGPSGLVSVQEVGTEPVRVLSDAFSFSVGSTKFSSASGKPSIRSTPDSITYTYERNGFGVDVIYRIAPDWHFVTKQIRLSRTPAAEFAVHAVEPINLKFGSPVDSIYTPGTYLPQFGAPRRDRPHPTKDFGAFVRFANHGGVMITVQNPFLWVHRTGNAVSIRYSPEMQWKSEWGPFLGDIACIAPYRLSGDRIPAKMIYEWKVPPASIPRDGADRNEIRAFADCVRAFLVNPSSKPISVEVGWTLNDYQIDVATAEGRAEYKRVIDTASALGIQNLLYSPANSELANIEQDADDWNWEHVLWLGFGQSIRGAQWDPASGAIPASVTDILDYAKSKKIGLLAYVYPSLPFSQNPDWLVKDSKRPTKNTYATLASREFQDFLLKELIAFKKRTGIAGYSFDYTFLNLPGSSAYAQWYGWRRVMESLKRAEPDIVIDGRQTYHMYGPWTWLAGSYPHPTGNDEQPESFVPFPDLHFDRVSADRMRFVNYWYRNYQFAPEEIIPGYMTHQTERSINVPPDNVTGGHPRDTKTVYTAYRRRDWDYLGYKYSVLSSIATAGWNNVVDMIPGRDLEEFRAFANSPEEAWMREWLGWTVRNEKYLRNTRTILGPPAIGKVDGTSAIVGDRGFLFLFNPNYRGFSAGLSLNSTIGLTSGKRFLIRELYPQQGRIIGKPGAGIWNYGDSLRVSLDGTSATVLEIQPAPETEEPIIFGSAQSNPKAVSQAVVNDGVLAISNVAGEPGTTREVGVLLPRETPVHGISVNGRAVRFERNGNFVSANIHFTGARFSHSQQVVLKPSGQGSLAGTFAVPRRVFSQLGAVQKAWPIAWDPEDYRTTWLVPGRLLLFVQFAEPNDRMNVSMTLDGKALALTKAYSSVRVDPGSFVGFYADLSRVAPDVRHTLTLRVPPGAKEKLQGVFFDNVETELTGEIAQ